MKLRDYAYNFLIILFIIGLVGTHSGWISREMVFTIYLFVFFITGMYWIYSGLRSYFFIRNVEKMPTTPVNLVTSGIFAITGRAISQEPRLTPISGRPCVYWSVTVESHYWGWALFRNGRNWKQLHSAESRTPFFIYDETGRIPINTHGAEMDIHSCTFAGYITKHGTHSLELVTMDERALSYINSLDEYERYAFLNYTYLIVTEYYIPENDALYIFGRAKPVGNPAKPTNSGTNVIRNGTKYAMKYIADSSNRVAFYKHSNWLNLRIFGGLVLSAGCFLLIPLLPEFEKNSLFVLLLTSIVMVDFAYFFRN